MFNLECFQADLFTKILNDPKQGVKNYPGLTPLISIAWPTKKPLQYYKLALPIEQHHQTYIFMIFALLTEERFT